MFTKGNSVEIRAVHMVACCYDVLMTSEPLKRCCHRVSEAELGQSPVMPSSLM